MAGCSSDDDATVNLDAGKREAAPVEAPPDADEVKTCMSDKQLDATGLAYNSPNIVKSACTKDDITKLGKFLDDAFDANNTKFKMSEWAAVVSKGCGDCAFSLDTAAKWGAVNKDAADAFAGYNYGACAEMVNGTAACGKTYHQVTICRLSACDACTTNEEFVDCMNNGQALFDGEGPCVAAFDAVSAACGGQTGLTRVGDACDAQATGWDYPFQRILELSCLAGGYTPVGDAGGDADADANP